MVIVPSHKSYSQPSDTNIYMYDWEKKNLE